ncbi:MAG: hypothetical protein KKB51_00745 [Candidatus Riflebacteria bacterium]|nr:hypothetical protein [Candidatus Riflebacteria bacterium]
MVSFKGALTGCNYIFVCESDDMERKEFELVLKRALELQSLQKTQQKAQQEESFALEDLQSAANRLGIDPAILDEAMRETNKKFKKFHFSESPEQVREDFLKHFLMNETVVGPGMSMVRIDHASIKTGTNNPIRAYHPGAPEIDAHIEFAAAAEGGTNVSWSGNSEIRTRTKVLVSGWPFLVLIPLIFSVLAQGTTLLPLLPLALVFFLTSMVMLWGIKHNGRRLEVSLNSYFQNCQTLDEIENQKQLKNELKQLRKQVETSQTSMDDSVLREPMPELQDDPDGEQSDSPRPPSGRLKE